MLGLTSHLQVASLPTAMPRELGKPFEVSNTPQSRTGTMDGVVALHSLPKPNNAPSSMVGDFPSASSLRSYDLNSPQAGRYP